MTRREAELLMAGDRVTWTDAGAVIDAGGVREVGYMGFKVAWDSGLISTHFYADLGLILPLARERPRGRRVVTCSWCHTGNEIVEGVANLCRSCHHMADRPRSSCACPRCCGVMAGLAGGARAKK